MELVSRELEIAQLRQALTSRISIEQAKGVLAASQEVTPNERFQQLRARARSSDGAPPIASLVATRLAGAVILVVPTVILEALFPVTAPW